MISRIHTINLSKGGYEHKLLLMMRRKKYLTIIISSQIKKNYHI